MDLPNFKRIVIKLGSNVVIDDHGKFARERMTAIFNNITRLLHSHHEIIIVSSGSVSLGKKALGLTEKLTLSQKQACAAVGQSLLMNSYQKLIGSNNKACAQVLVTSEDLADRKRYLNLRETLDQLLEMEVIPIMNENDSISTMELDDSKSFGDNDKLSALVASKMGAELLILLTDVDGIYDDNPHLNQEAQKISVFNNLKELKEIKSTGKSRSGRGGVKTKLEASMVASLSGVYTIIANGFDNDVLKNILASKKSIDDNRPGSLILPEGKISQKKRWIGFSSGVHGIITVNIGAQNALEEKHASLLPIGIVNIDGDFKKGQVVSIQDEQGLEIGRGQCNMDAKDIQPNEKGEEVIHRDYLVMFQEYFNG